MKRSRFGIGAGFMLALAGLVGSAQATQPLTQANTQNEMKATQAAKQKTRHSVTNTIGGVPLTSFLPDYGMSPKEYGIRFGHGNKKGKTNLLRSSHNAKLKRRG